MTTLLSLTSPSAAAPQPAQEFLDAVGFSADLPARLICDADGRPFAPPQLGLVADLARLAGQITLLQRSDPLGGVEPLLQHSEQALAREVRARLHRRLSVSADGLPTRAFLIELQDALRQLREQLATLASQAEAGFNATQQQLHRWQQRTARQEAAGFIGGLLRLLGGDAGLSPAQVITLWNAREQLHVRLAAARAALALVSAFLDDVSLLVDRLDAVQSQVAQRLRALAQRAPAPTGFAAPTLMVDAPTVAARIADQSEVVEPLGTLLAALAENGWQEIGAHSERIAREAAARQLAGLDICRLLEIDAAQATDADDPLLALGQGLLALLDRQQTWQLVGTARPRVERVQITPDGQPIYVLDGLSSASSGAPGDGLGFLEVQLNVAPAELRQLADGGEAFDAALCRRNFYALEELALSWEARATVVMPLEMSEERRME
jgi:hypothetical protein